MSFESNLSNIIDKCVNNKNIELESEEMYDKYKYQPVLNKTFEKCNFNLNIFDKERLERFNLIFQKVKLTNEEKEVKGTSRNWGFTLNNPTQEEFDLLCNLTAIKDSECNFVLFESEKVSTSHFQGYLEFKSAFRMHYVKSIFPRMNLWMRRGTQGQAMAYSIKDAQGKLGSDVFCFGKCHADSQGTRNDIIETTESLIPFERPLDFFRRHKDSDHGIRKINCMAKYSRFFKEIQSDLEYDESLKRRNVEVEIYFGKSRSGKSKKALYDAADLTRQRKDVYKFNCSGKDWWPNYFGQTTLVLEEFYGQLPYSWLLDLIDGNSFSLEKKGSNTYANWTKVIIISNKEPCKWYKKTQKNIDAFIGRVNVIKEFISNKKLLNNISKIQYFKVDEFGNETEEKDNTSLKPSSDSEVPDSQVTGNTKPSLERALYGSLTLGEDGKPYDFDKNKLIGFKSCLYNNKENILSISSKSDIIHFFETNGKTGLYKPKK